MMGFVWGILGGVIGGAITAVVVEIVIRKLFGPKLAVDFHVDRPLESYFTHTTTVEGQPCCYVKIKVVNAGKRSAKNCRGFLVAFEEWNPTTSKYEAVAGNDTLQLIWTQSPKEEERLGFDMSPGVGRFLDVVTTAEGQPNFWFCTSRNPTKFHPYLSRPGKYRLVIQVSAEEAEPKLIPLLLDWDGNWNNPKVMPECR